MILASYFVFFGVFSIILGRKRVIRTKNAGNFIYIWVNSANLMIFGQKTHQIGVFYPKIAELVLFSPKSNKIMTLSKFRQFGH